MQGAPTSTTAPTTQPAAAAISSAHTHTHLRLDLHDRLAGHHLQAQWGAGGVRVSCRHFPGKLAGKWHKHLASWHCASVMRLGAAPRWVRCSARPPGGPAAPWPVMTVQQGQHVVVFCSLDCPRVGSERAGTAGQLPLIPDRAMSPGTPACHASALPCPSHFLPLPQTSTANAHLPAAKIWVGIPVVPHQRRLLGLDERAVCGLGVQLQRG